MRTITIFGAFARANAAVVRARNTSTTCENAKGILKTARECGTDTSVVQRIKAEMGQDHTSDA